MRILVFDRRQRVKEKDFQITFASDAPKRLKKFSDAVSAGEISFSVLHCDERSLCLERSQRTRRLLVKTGSCPCQPVLLVRNPNTPSADLTAIIWTVTPWKCLF